MMRTLLVPALLLFAGCSNNGLAFYNTPPVVTITAPLDGAEFPEGETITFEGLVADNGPVTDLQADWIDSVAGPLEEDTFVDADGTVQLITSILEPGAHTIVLRAYDLSAETADSRIEISIVDVPDKPSVTVLHPDVLGNEKGLEDNPFIFMVEVSDYQDPAEDLTVELTANPYGLVCTMSPDGSGIAQCPGNLPLGPYTLTFVVTDTDGNSVIANAPFAVVTRGDYDMDGDGYSPNGGDCNDSANTIYPGADEVCDGLDNDCNELTAIDVGTECYDDDGDGYCEEPPCVNTPQTLADCDDTNPERYPNPSVVELPNGIDDDCDGTIDEGTNVYDDDGDGFCESPPCINASGTESDCDDGDYEVYPGADEICGDGFDNDCDGKVNEENAIGCVDFYYDSDADGWGIPGTTECWCSGSYPYTGTNASDCYDNNANAWPGQSSYYGVHRGDGSYDYDCDGSEEKKLRGSNTGCSWDFEPFSCGIDAAGWEGSEPDCGDTGVYSDDCSGTYDVICIILCAYSDPSLCTSCWDCELDESSETQTCR